MKNNKGAIELTTTSLIIGIIIAGIFVYFISWLAFGSDECSQKDIDNGDCECLETCQDKYGLDDNYRFNKAFLERSSPYFKGDWNCIERVGREKDLGKIYKISDKCLKYSKKNPCQLKLEKEGILGEDCICEEEFAKEIYCSNLDKYSEIEIIKIEPRDKENTLIPLIGFENFDCSYEEVCVKAREKTECEKGNPEYILDFCLKDEIIGNPDKIRYCAYKCPLNESELCWMPMSHSNYQKSCRKKTFEDLNCSELESIYDSCNPFGRECSKEDINHQMILNGC